MISTLQMAKALYRAYLPKVTQLLSGKVGSQQPVIRIIFLYIMSQNSLWKTLLRKWKGKIQTGRKYLQYIYLKRTCTRTYKECFQVSTKKTTQLKIDKTEQTPYREAHKWPISPCRYSTSLVIREIQVKSMIIYQHTPMRMAKSKMTETMCPGRCGETRKLMHCWWEYKMM